MKILALGGPGVLSALLIAAAGVGAHQARITERGSTAVRDLQRPQPGTAAQQLAGAWQLETRTVRRLDGTVLADQVLSGRPPGRLFYDRSGVMALQMMRLGRKTAIGTPADARDAGNARVVLGYDAYFGSYAVDERAGTITHHVEGSLFP